VWINVTEVPAGTGMSSSVTVPLKVPVGPSGKELSDPHPTIAKTTTEQATPIKPKRSRQTMMDAS